MLVNAESKILISFADLSFIVVKGVTDFLYGFSVTLLLSVVTGVYGFSVTLLPSIVTDVTFFK